MKEGGNLAVSSTNFESQLLPFPCLMTHPTLQESLGDLAEEEEEVESGDQGYYGYENSTGESSLHKDTGYILGGQGIESEPFIGMGQTMSNDRYMRLMSMTQTEKLPVDMSAVLQTGTEMEDISV